MLHLSSLRSTAFIALASLSTMACSPDGATNPPIEMTRSALSASLGEDARPTGFAIDEETGLRYFLDPALGILEQRPSGEVVSVWSATDELPPLTDLCAVGGGRFVAAADGDGYVIDIATGAARQHFCLEPGWDPDFGSDPEIPLAHLNQSVACDVEAGLIYGQPQTVPRDGPSDPLRSEMASYRLSTGADVDWIALPDVSYHAGGMTVLETGRILLGAGSTISLYEATTQTLTLVAELHDEGVERIDAISIDRAAGTVELVDGPKGELVTITLDALGL